MFGVRLVARFEPRLIRKSKKRAINTELHKRQWVKRGIYTLGLVRMCALADVLKSPT